MQRTFCCFLLCSAGKYIFTRYRGSNKLNPEYLFCEWKDSFHLCKGMRSSRNSLPDEWLRCVCDFWRVPLSPSMLFLMLFWRVPCPTQHIFRWCWGCGVNYQKSYSSSTNCELWIQAMITSRLLNSRIWSIGKMLWLESFYWPCFQNLQQLLKKPTLSYFDRQLA